MTHADEARTALKAAQETPAEEVITDPWLLAAQVHATLELAEQQRIANLIALGSLQILSGIERPNDIVGDGSAFRALYPDGPVTPLAPEIAAALKIGDQA